MESETTFAKRGTVKMPNDDACTAIQESLQTQRHQQQEGSSAVSKLAELLGLKLNGSKRGGLQKGNNPDLPSGTDQFLAESLILARACERAFSFAEKASAVIALIVLAAVKSAFA